MPKTREPRRSGEVVDAKGSGEVEEADVRRCARVETGEGAVLKEAKGSSLL